MPKLPQERIAGANEQEAGDYQPLPTTKGALYVYRLTEVEEGVTGENSKNPGTPKWVWKLAVDKDYHPELKSGRWQTTLFEHVPHTPSMDWKNKALFHGFGYSTDSDTDEIIEDPDARIVVKVKTGKDIVSGEPRTQSASFKPFDPSKWEKHDADEDDNQ